MNTKMQKIYGCLLLMLCQLPMAFSQNNNWQMVEGSIASTWAEKVDPAQPLPEYPRPQMVREEWQNLNGLWDYTILPAEAESPTAFHGKILVPFAVESALSGVGKTVGKDSVLWYQQEISIPSKMRRNKLLLHFGAVDWQATVFVNDQEVGVHEGGYDPFAFDISQYLNKGSKQTIKVKVWDPSDEGPQPRGKQVKRPEGIWYTPVTGIWQTVWLEPVPETHIISSRHTPDIDNNKLSVAVNAEALQQGDEVRITVSKDGKQLTESTNAATATQELTLKDPILWSPDNPALYDLKLAIIRKGKVIDAVDSYFAMRKISMMPDENGVQRMMLNNKFLFQFGPLDQGWWPDGLYTAPTEGALLFDIEKTMEMGFNMIRKHVKVEPARWYHHCDKLGMLVWQDMPNGDQGTRWGQHPGIDGLAQDMERSEASEAIFRKEWAAIMDDFHNFPSIVVWVPFNEAWGQFKTVEITEWTMERDPSRLVNSASGGNFFPTGHILDIHNYPAPAMPRAELFGKERILALGEYGGLGLPVEGHTWQEKDNWGYQSFENEEELFEKYKEFINRIKPMIPKGLSAAIYTQTTDVEVETNGLMTYDRKVIKFSEEKLKALHQELYDAFQGEFTSKKDSK